MDGNQRRKNVHYRNTGEQKRTTSKKVTSKQNRKVSATKVLNRKRNRRTIKRYFEYYKINILIYAVTVIVVLLLLTTIARAFGNKSSDIKEVETSIEETTTAKATGTIAIPLEDDTSETLAYIGKKVNFGDQPPTTEAATVQETEPDLSYMVTDSTKITFDGVNVRLNPSTDAKILTVISPRTPVDIIDTEDGWTKVLIDNNIAYIKSDYIGNPEGYDAYVQEQERKKDKTPYSDYLINEYGFSKDLQKYLWSKCCEMYSKPENQKNYYAFILGVMQQESHIGKDKSHWNSNGSRDLGIMQVNSCNWKTLKRVGIISGYDMATHTCDDLMNDYIGIDAGMYMLNQYVLEFGISEGAYYWYNTGTKNRNGRNSSSAKVMQYYNEWKNRLYGG